MKRFTLNLDLSGLIIVIAVGVLLPVLLSTAAGIVALVIARDAGMIVTGVLVVSFAVTALGSALVAVVLAGRKAQLARRQADFVANVTHELRTPLSAIRLYAQTLQSGKVAGDPAETARCLDTIVRETEWLDVMIARVLTWRASSGEHLRLEMTVQSVERAVREAAERFRNMVPPDEVAFRVDLAATTPVRHDPAALNAVILNLLTNAYKYTGREKRIRLSARDTAAGVAIDVTDNGVGMTPAEAGKVFQPFYRAEHGEGSRRMGAGLGLTIARYVIERHGGAIDVATEKDRGSTFAIRLPAADGRNTRRTECRR